MTTRAAIYLRVSLDRTGEELAVERQLQDCQNLAKNRGWDVVDVYTDNSISASKRYVKRPEYDRMIADFEAGRFNAIVCWDLDRLTRQPRQLEDWIEAAETRGLILTTANGEADLSHDGGRMYARIKAAVAKAEIERKSQRQIRAAVQRAEKGKVPAGVRLTGYTTTGAVIEEEAALVRGLFVSFASGESLKGLAAQLQLKGITTRNGNPWSSSTISTILKNARYAGRAVYRAKALSTPGQWEAIVSEDLFDAVNARLADPRRKLNKSGTSRKHLGSGLFICGICLNPLQTNGTRYWCKTGGHVTRSMAPVDNRVENVILERLQKPDVAALLAPSNDARATKLDGLAKGYRQRLEAIEADYDDGIIDGRRYAVASEKITQQLRAVEQERATLMAGSVVGGLLTGPNPADAYEGASLDVKRAVLDALVIVRVLPAPRGVKGFNPDTVLELWRRSRAVLDGVEPVVTQQAVEALQAS